MVAVEAVRGARRGRRARRVATLALSALLTLSGAPPARAASGSGAVRPVPGALLYARVSAGRRAPYLQEVFAFTVSVYSRGLTMGREIALRNRETPGLAFLPYADLGTTREQVEGKLFEVHRFLGRAQAVSTGTFAVEPEVSVSVVLPAARGAAGGAQVQRAEVRPEPLSVSVLPLPAEGRPEGYGGAVGDFTFSAAAGPAAVAAGEPVTVTMTIEGSGNLDSVAAPRVPADARFAAYEPRLVQRASGASGRGRLVFEQTLVPRTAGATPLPAVRFSFFDPVRGSYRAVAAGPFPLQVRAAARAEAVVVDAGPAGPARVRPALGPEIAPLKAAPARWTALAARPWYARRWLLALQVVPLVAALALLVAARRREALARDVAAARRHAAPSAARSRLAAAAKALRDGAPRRFHEALWAALAAYFGNRLNLQPGQLSRDVVTARLGAAGLDGARLARLEQVFDLSERERFGPPAPPERRFTPEERERLAALLEELEALLEACEGLAR